MGEEAGGGGEGGVVQVGGEGAEEDVGGGVEGVGVVGAGVAEGGDEKGVRGWHLV